MKRSLICVAVLLSVSVPCWAQQNSKAKSDPAKDAAVDPNGAAPDGDASDPVNEAIRARIKAYVEAFNSHDASAVGSFWAENGVSVNEETGDRKVGREALVQDFAAIFEASPEIRLAGQLDNLHLLRPDVACAEGQCTLFVGDAEPTTCVFTATLIKEGDEWLISSSHEHNLPTPATPYDALKELDWLVGTWQDQTDSADVTTTFQWTESRAFLIRSYVASFDDESSLQGTQIIGWDPLNQQIRTWSFNSDGSFGQGTLSKNGEDWMLKMTQVLSDGRLAAGTSVMTAVDENRFTIQKIGETVDGEPSPTAEPITVVRVDAEAAGTPDASDDAEGEK